MKTNFLAFSLIIIFILFIIFHLPAQQRGLKVVCTPQGTDIPLYNSSYALVVGNGKYTEGWDDLPPIKVPPVELDF